MNYFQWKEAGLTKDCESLEAMAARFEESAKLMRKMSKEGFYIKTIKKEKFITHDNSKTFEEWGFVSEVPPYRQLALIPDKGITLAKD